MKKVRCGWCENDELYQKYHDEEWGVPQHNDNRLFEKIILEGAQAGLSWITILRKRDYYRKVYDNFDPQLVAAYDDEKIENLINDPGIIRNKLKIRSSVNNAQAFLKIQKEFGSFDAYIWKWVGNKPIVNYWKTLADVPAQTELSQNISKDLKKRGFKFVGPTIIYAYLQSCGMLNDHLVDCFRHQELIG